MCVYFLGKRYQNLGGRFSFYFIVIYQNSTLHGALQLIQFHEKFSVGNKEGGIEFNSCCLVLCCCAKNLPSQILQFTSFWLEGEGCFKSLPKIVLFFMRSQFLVIVTISTWNYSVLLAYYECSNLDCKYSFGRDISLSQLLKQLFYLEVSTTKEFIEQKAGK